MYGEEEEEGGPQERSCVSPSRNTCAWNVCCMPAKSNRKKTAAKTHKTTRASYSYGFKKPATGLCFRIINQPTKLFQIDIGLPPTNVFYNIHANLQHTRWQQTHPIQHGSVYSPSPSPAGHGFFFFFNFGSGLRACKYPCRGLVFENAKQYPFKSCVSHVFRPANHLLLYTPCYVWCTHGSSVYNILSCYILLRKETCPFAIYFSLFPYLHEKLHIHHKMLRMVLFERCFHPSCRPAAGYGCLPKQK